MKTNSAKIVSALKPCVDPDHRENIYYLTKALTFDSFLDYICFNSSEIVRTFIQNGGEECLRERDSELRQCYFVDREDKIVNGINKKISESPMTIEEVKKAHNDKDCRVRKIIRTCIKKELDHCPSPSTSGFILGLLDRMPGPLCNEHNPN